MIYLMTVENLFWSLFLAIILPLDAILFQSIGGSYCILEIAKPSRIVVALVFWFSNWNFKNPKSRTNWNMHR